MSIISALYEYNPKTKDYMEDEHFVDAIKETRDMIDILIANETILLRRVYKYESISCVMSNLNIIKYK